MLKKTLESFVDLLLQRLFPAYFNLRADVLFGT